MSSDNSSEGALYVPDSWNIQGGADEKTKEALLSAVWSKLDEPSQENAWKQRELQRPGQDHESIRVIRYGERTHLGRRGIVARVAITNFIEDSNGERQGERTTYSLCAIPDGLHVQRTRSMAPKPLRVTDRDTDTAAGIVTDALGGRVLFSGSFDINSRREAQRAEHEEARLGLHNVDEEEVAMLISMLRQAQPLGT